MLRPSDSLTSSLLKGNRPYQIALVVLTLVFGFYVLSTSRSNSLNEYGRIYPGSPGGMMHAVVQQPAVCECNCNCDKSSAPTAAAAASTVVALPTATETPPTPSNAVVASGQWVASSKQTYGILPTIIDGSHQRYVRAAYPPVGPELGSILDGSYFETPIAYGTMHVPIQDGLVSAPTPSGLIPRPACQVETDILQNYIYANQHPPNCKTAKLLVRRHMPSYGLFAGLGLSSNYLFLASVLGRTLVDLSPNTYFTGNCKAEGLECAFLPIGGCTSADFSEHEICYDSSCWDTARVISIDRQRLSDFLPCAPTEYPKERCNRDGGPPIHRSLNEILPNLKSHGEQFFQGEFTRYLTRPNAQLQEYTASQMKELGLTDQLISVHVRHGDKEEGIQFPTRAYSLIVRRVVQITGIKTVFIGTDDKSVYEELPRWVGLEGITYKWLNPDLNPIVFSAAQAAQQGKNTIGMNLMAQTIIFLQSQAYIGTRSSNAGQVVYAMQGNDCSRQKIAYDMYGDLFYNSWYCRGDIEHAGREWMCALQKPKQGEGLIWQWGGAKTQCH